MRCPWLRGTGSAKRLNPLGRFVVVSSSTSAGSRKHRFGLRSLMSALVLIPLLLTGMATGTVFASGSDVNGGGVVIPLR